ncbi:MAG: hypothetical protein P4M15_15075 [Alphaproteobacteria bacterium]|nr:hypothetical protein [Alphaproteobacteria bacterium]
MAITPHQTGGLVMDAGLARQTQGMLNAVRIADDPNTGPLAVDGLITEKGSPFAKDSKTGQALNNYLDNILGKHEPLGNDDSALVKKMQQVLGFKGADIDGEFGPKTQAAWRAYAQTHQNPGANLSTDAPAHLSAATIDALKITPVEIAALPDLPSTPAAGHAAAAISPQDKPAVTLTGAQTSPILAAEQNTALKTSATTLASLPEFLSPPVAGGASFKPPVETSMAFNGATNATATQAVAQQTAPAAPGAQKVQVETVRPDGTLVPSDMAGNVMLPHNVTPHVDVNPRPIEVSYLSEQLGQTPKPVPAAAAAGTPPQSVMQPQNPIEISGQPTRRAALTGLKAASAQASVAPSANQSAAAASQVPASLLKALESKSFNSADAQTLSAQIFPDAPPEGASTAVAQTRTAPASAKPAATGKPPAKPSIVTAGFNF